MLTGSGDTEVHAQAMQPVRGLFFGFHFAGVVFVAVQAVTSIISKESA